MRYGALLWWLLLPLSVFCKDKHKELKLPISRWREVKRMGLDSTVKTFADTLYISFRHKDSFQYHVPGGFIYNGAYTIDEDSILDLGTAKFKIVLKRPNTLVFTDDKGLYVMGPDIIDTYQTVVLQKEDSALPVKSIDQMIGHWTVYKKTTDKQSDELQFASEIKAVFITGPSSDGKQGYVYGGLDPMNYPSWYIKDLANDQTLECNGKSLRNIRVVKCQKGELVIEVDGVKYYLKQFK